MANVNRMRSNRRMESSVRRTYNHEGRHVMQQSDSSPTKTDTDLIRTPLRPIIYTPAQLHENIVNCIPSVIGLCLYKISLWISYFYLKRYSVAQPWVDGRTVSSAQPFITWKL